MDYHLDWIYASLYLTQNNPTGRVERNFIEENEIAIDYQISGTQEDVDFLLAFVDHENTTHILMIEAKGDNYFSNNQLDSKNKRFKAIFGSKDTWPNVKPHFLICSPKEPQNVSIKEPAYFIFKSSKLLWLELDMGDGKNKVTRWGKDDKPCGDGKYWVVESRS